MTPAGEFPPVVFIDLYQTPKPKWWHGTRYQTWRWRAMSEGNGRVLASGESFTNRSGAVASIYLLFGHGSSVLLRQAELGDVVLREAT